jgi:hypothetical protein
VSAVNDVCPVRATSTLVDDGLTSAALPTEASGELASMLRVIVPLTTLLLIVDIAGSPLGLVGLLLPQPVRAVAIAARDNVSNECTQNSRREYFGSGMTAPDATVVPEFRDYPLFTAA